MVDLTLLHVPYDVQMAQRIREDLQDMDVQIYDSVQPRRDALTVLVLSPQALQSDSFMQTMYAALDQHQHIIPVLAKSMDLPREIDHLQAIDFSTSYQPGQLKQRITVLSAPDAPPPLTVLTPQQRRANRRFGLIFVVVVVVVFAVSLYAIAVLGLRAPEDEFASVETQIILTRNHFIDDALPRSTEDASAFQATYDEMPTRAQFQLGLTATAIADGVIGTFVPQSSQEATGFPTTLESVSTVVQVPLAATATAQAQTTDDD